MLAAQAVIFDHALLNALFDHIDSFACCPENEGNTHFQ
jgi:hypothetical protein